MKNLILENFRMFEKPTKFDLAPITVFTGRNNSGKSSILKSLMLLSDYLNDNSQTVLNFDGALRNKHSMNHFGNAKSWGKNDFFTVSYHNEHLIVEIKFEGKDIDFFGLLKSFEIKTVENNQRLKITRLSKTNFELSFSPAFFHAFEHSISDDGLLGNEIYDIANLKNNLKNLNEQIKKISKSSRSDQDNLKLVDELNRLNDRKKNLSDQIKRLEKIYEGSLFEFNTTIEIKENQKLKIVDLIYHGITKSLSENKLNELKNFYAKRIDKKYNFNNTLMTLIRELGNMINFRIYHLSANRYYPANYYEADGKYSDLVYELKQYALKVPVLGSEKVLFLNHWLKEFGIGVEFFMEILEDKLFFPEIRIWPENRKVKLPDLGHGSGQLLPILLRIVNLITDNMVFTSGSFIPGGRTIIVEEPEANLHPKLQSLLAKMFYDAWKKFAIKFILETHSEYMIRSFQALVNEQQNNSFLKIYYLYENGPYEMIIGDDGKFQNEFGQGFFDESARQAFKIL